MCEAWTRRALTGGKGCGRMGPEAISSYKNGNERDHRDRARTVVGMHTTTTIQTRIRARMDGHRVRVRTGVGWNGRRHYAGEQAMGAGVEIRPS
jgi:hypothetical protein